MPPTEFSIPIHDLDAAGKEFRFPVRAAWIRGALEGEEVKPTDKDGSLEVRVSKSGTDVVVHGRLQAELELPCARCLEPATVPIDQTIAVLMVPAAGASGAKQRGGKEDEEYEFSAEEADVVPYEGDTIALDDLVRDELLLELPMIPLCSPDCAGISPPPGTLAEEPAERPIDPRLAPLLKLSLAARVSETKNDSRNRASDTSPSETKKAKKE